MQQNVPFCILLKKTSPLPLLVSRGLACIDSLEKLKIILNPDKEILPSVTVCNFIKRSLEARL